jgi:hypothetical protein
MDNYVFYSNYKRLSQQIEFRRRLFRSAGCALQKIRPNLAAFMGLRPWGPGADRLCVSAASRPAKSGNATVAWSVARSPHGNVCGRLPTPDVPVWGVSQVVLVGDGRTSMATAVRDVTGSELRLFGDTVARLERLGPESDARAVIWM